MSPSTLGSFAAILGAVAVIIALGPGTWTAITHRESDNGLSFGVLSLGVVIWNGTTVFQLFTSDPTTYAYFFLLSLVGASIAGLGWVLFASTASSTPDALGRRPIYALIALAVGVNVGLVGTTPVHGLYWNGLADATTIFGTATVVVATSHWIHTLLVAGLFSAGGVLFAASEGRRGARRYSLAYAVSGVAVTLAVVTNNATAPGAGMAAPVLASGIVGIGVVQARRS